MAIPGLKPSYDVRAKVRIGEKVKRNGKEFPSSTDYFICDDTVFAALAGSKPKSIRVLLPYAEAADNFSTGLEFWRGKQLTCYAKGDTVAGQNAAYRVNAMLAGFTVIGEPMGRGKERTPVACAFRDCPNFKAKDCKPMGRLQFFLEGGPVDSVFQLDTKSWNTIEGVEATLAAALTKGDLRGRVFELSVAIQQKATQKFPVVSLKEVPVNISNDADVEKADAFLRLNAALSTNDEGIVREELARTLDVTNPGWRAIDGFAARIREVGVTAAATGLLARYQA